MARSAAAERIRLQARHSRVSSLEKDLANRPASWSTSQWAKYVYQKHRIPWTGGGGQSSGAGAGDSPRRNLRQVQSEPEQVPDLPQPLDFSIDEYNKSLAAHARRNSARPFITTGYRGEQGEEPKWEPSPYPGIYYRRVMGITQFWNTKNNQYSTYPHWNLPVITSGPWFNNPSTKGLPFWSKPLIKGIETIIKAVPYIPPWPTDAGTGRSNRDPIHKYGYAQISSISRKKRRFRSFSPYGSTSYATNRYKTYYFRQGSSSSRRRYRLQRSNSYRAPSFYRWRYKRGAQFRWY